jgi:hypothetical protein
VTVAAGRSALRRARARYFELARWGACPASTAFSLWTPRGAMVGGLANASSKTTYIESAAGVAEGARTGLAAVVTGALCLVAMWVAPLAQVVPS